MSEITITLAGSEVKAQFSGSNAWLRNDGADAIYAAKSSGITAGAAGVTSIPAGQSAPVYGANGTVFLLGTGSVMLIGSDYSTNPFKVSAQGGSGSDTVARAAINAHAGNGEIHVTADEKAGWNGKADLSDIPTTLPANGGNADTIDGLHTTSLAQNIGTWATGTVKDLVLSCKKSGFVFIDNIVTGRPHDNGYWFGIVDCNTVHRCIRVKPLGNSTKSYTMTYNATLKTWYGWYNNASGGDAESVGSYTEEKLAALEARIAALEGGT